MLIAISALLLVGLGQDTPSPTPDFGLDIAPVLQKACGQCHIGSAMGRLRLDSPAAVLRGGVSGPAIVPGHSSESLLVKRLLGEDGKPRMPLAGQPLSATEIDLIRRWIDGGQFEAAETYDPEGEQSPVFAKQIRPLLAQRCYSCHGSKLAQNGLRLDSLAFIKKGSDYGPIIVPHKPDKSRLIRRLEAQERPQMPYGGPPLTHEQIATIRQWIDAGAPGPDGDTPITSGQAPKHWAYVKPVMPVLPAVKDTAWVRNPIDNFVLAKLEKEGLTPAPEADKSTLLRRVYLDITGLPPTPGELSNFLADHRPDAYERVVDRLFASPHYGERWARQWLDLARYADSNGYEKDRRRTAWEYRDWVIRALNADLSFRDFTIDQIAGDMLPNPTNDQLIATGFNRNSMLNQEGGIDVNEYYYYSEVDRANTTSLVWLGSTLGCAQCHNHKFDPFPQKDYYRFLAFFSNTQNKIAGVGDHWTEEPELELPNAAQATRSAEIREQISRLQDRLNTQTPALDAAQARWELRLTECEKQWTTLRPSEYRSVGGADMRLLADGSLLVGGVNPEADRYVIKAPLSSSAVTGIRLEVLPDGSLPHNGPGRDPAGNFFLSDFDVQVGSGAAVVWKKNAADESQDGYEASKIVKKEPGQLSGWAINETQDSPLRRQVVFIPDKPISGDVLVITLKHEMRHSARNIGHFRISVTQSKDPEFVVSIPAALRPVLDIPRDQRTGKRQEELSAAYRSVAPDFDSTRQQIAELEKALKSLDVNTAMVMREKAAGVRPSAYIRERGTYTSPGELVYADVPGALNPLPKDVTPNRLALAKWLVSDDNPLTARVTVNHFWEAIFGHGIVETSEDFGTQGDTPSHPQLLDWLAVQFMKDGWSMKKIQRLIVTSATYRQDSRVTPELLAKDPYNKLYAHGPRFRVDAETVHDIALAESDLLSGKMFGPPVFPYQPEGVWDIPYSNDKWVESGEEDRHRRSVYTFIRRSAPYPSLVTYDAPSREFCTVRRVRTNTPLQALTSLNDPFFFDAARAMGLRLMREGGTSMNDRIKYGFTLTVSRKPTAAELEKVSGFFRAEEAKYRNDPKAALQVIGAKATSEHVDTAEAAAWTVVSNVLLNTDEAITKE
jgi:mono/diheme cytochrome c family protein